MTRDSTGPVQQFAGTTETAFSQGPDINGTHFIKYRTAINLQNVLLTLLYWLQIFCNYPQLYNDRL